MSGKINGLGGGFEAFDLLEILGKPGASPENNSLENLINGETAFDGDSSQTVFAEKRGINNPRQANLLAANIPRSEAFNYSRIAGLIGNPNVTAGFLRGVEGMAQRLGTRPEYLLAVMSFETGGSFSPAERNGIGATGLIQFLPDTARGLGTSTGELAQMSPTEQLKYVEKYLAPFKGNLGSLEKIYTSVLSGSPKPDGDSVLFRRGTRAYDLNPLDWNKDGKITASEATTPVAARMFGGVRAVQQRLVDTGFVPQNRQNKFADGKWGQNTAAALSDFQRSRGLNPTGALDAATGRALFNLTDAPPVNAPPVANPKPTTNPRPATNENYSIVPHAGLHRGQHSRSVEKLQDALIKLGHLTEGQKRTGPGTFGPRTEAAVKEFQRANHLPANGRLDAATREAMSDITASVGRGRNVNTSVTKAVQDKLVKLGYMTRAQVNTGYGTFGPRTEAAIKKFQADHNIEKTGALGATTYKALQNAEPRRANPNPTNPTNGGGSAPGYATATNGRHYTVNNGILMTNELRPRLETLAQRYFERTGNNLHVTSGYRPPARQASAMYDLIARNGTGYVRDLYANKGAVNQILNAYSSNSGSRASAVNAMTDVIDRQVGNGTYISSHLRSRALDFSTNTNLAALREIVAGMGGTVLNEGDHYHVQL